MEDMGNYGYTLFRTIPSLDKLLPNKSVRRMVRSTLFLALLPSLTLIQLHTKDTSTQKQISGALLCAR